MASAKPNPMHGFARGIFGLKNTDPLRKPKGRGLDGCVDQSASRPGQFNQSPPQRSENSHPGASQSQFRESQQTADRNDVDKAKNNLKVSKDLPKKGAQLKAGYSYTANPNSPLGHELSFSQNDSLKFVQVHETNPEWWVADTANGMGYVPAKYMISCEVSSLPWLKGGEEIEEKQKKDIPTATNVFGQPEKGTFKAYRASYDHADIKTTPAISQWHCDVCDKDFNGPKPYQAHMVSKAHREEVEYRKGQ